jgi:predicted anti-sigma-YlaC factor YlaD
LADPLESPVAREVEDHLLECRYCREFFLAVLSMRGEARMVKAMRAGTDGGPLSNAKVTKLSDFKKEWP